MIDAIYNAPLISAYLQIEALENTDENLEKNEETKAFVKLKAPNIENLYKNKGQKQKDIRAAMENPLSGPRFTYLYDDKKECQPRKTSNGNEIIKQLAKNKHNNSALASLVKKPSGIGGLSRLISRNKTDASPLKKLLNQDEDSHK